MSSKLKILAVVVGVALRYFLLTHTVFREWLEKRVEINTPLNSWSRVQEGIYLRSNLNQSPYDGNIFHEIPFMLYIYMALQKLVNLNFLFIFIDMMNAVLVSKISDKMFDFLERHEITQFKMKKYEKLFNSQNKLKPSKFLISSSDNIYKSDLTLILYCLNPFLILCCVAKSTIVFHNFILCLWLYFLLADRYHTSFIFLALHAHISVYSILLVVPAIVYISALKRLDNDAYVLEQKINQTSDFTMRLIYYMGFFGLCLSCYFGVNLALNNFDVAFVKSTYLFIFEVDDLQPNLGLFWYFFTEMFEHFRVFFTYVFQLNVFIFLIPLTMRLYDSPIILIYIQMGLIAIFKSYPSLGDCGFYLTLLPTFIYLFRFMRSVLIYACMLVCGVCLGPIMWHLWLSSGSGNANFYFAITLVYSVAQIFLLVDILYAHLKREYIKVNGHVVPVCADGTKASLVVD